jgi:hypothetical protein
LERGEEEKKEEKKWGRVNGKSRRDLIGLMLSA